MDEEIVQMLSSWLRVFLAAGIGIYATTGVLDLNLMLNAGIAAVLPMVLRWLDPEDKAYGRK